MPAAVLGQLVSEVGDATTDTELAQLNAYQAGLEKASRSGVRTRNSVAKHRGSLSMEPMSLRRPSTAPTPALAAPRRTAPPKADARTDSDSNASDDDGDDPAASPPATRPVTAPAPHHVAYQGRLSTRSPAPLFERPMTAGSHKKQLASKDFKWL